jgi:hypothetical protein
MLTRGRYFTYFRHAVPVMFFILVACLSRNAYAQVARMEVIPFESVTLTDEEFLAGREDGKPVTVGGELRLPRAGTERLPLVILLHGSGGIAGFVVEWERDLLAMGVATFVIDSFTGRGIINTNNDQSQLGRLAQTEDAYRALAVLAKHPRIDPTRVMLMGFSRGARMRSIRAWRGFSECMLPGPGCTSLLISPSIQTAVTRTATTKTLLRPCAYFMEPPTTMTRLRRAVPTSRG